MYPWYLLSPGAHHSPVTASDVGAWWKHLEKLQDHPCRVYNMLSLLRVMSGCAALYTNTVLQQ